MKYPVARFKNLAVALKELGPFIRNGEHLQTRKPLPKLTPRQKEEAILRRGEDQPMHAIARSYNGPSRISRLVS